MSKKKIQKQKSKEKTLAQIYKEFERDFAYKPLKGGPALGMITRSSTNCLFVPGSISNANKTGDMFAKIIKDKYGFTPSIMNSQMSSTEYPGQYKNTTYAKYRNRMLENQIQTFIEQSPDEDIIIFAHSAGTGQLHRALLRTFVPEKRIHAIYIGPGHPSRQILQKSKHM